MPRAHSPPPTAAARETMSAQEEGRANSRAGRGHRGSEVGCCAPWALSYEAPIQPQLAANKGVSSGGGCTQPPWGLNYETSA